MPILANRSAHVGCKRQVQDLQRSEYHPDLTLCPVITRTSVHFSLFWALILRDNCLNAVVYFPSSLGTIHCLKSFFPFVGIKSFREEI